MNEKNWDDISIDYDLSVEKNKDPVIVNYLQKEMNVVGQLCRKVLKNNNNQCSVVEMGSGTGRAIFSLNNMLNNTSIQFYGIEISKHMIKRANEKKSFYSENQNIRFMMHDSTDSGLCELFTSNTANIVMCLYNTIGVIHPDKRTTFIDNMLRLAGEKGMVIISAFNGDDFNFVAPSMYMPMKKMIKQIDQDSFDEKNKVFQNKLGYHSQWFTKNELVNLLQSNSEPIPIDVLIDDKSRILGHIFIN